MPRQVRHPSIRERHHAAQFIAGHFVYCSKQFACLIACVCVCVRVRVCMRARAHTHTHTHIHRQLIDKRRIYYSWPMFAAREISQEILLSDESMIANYHVFGNVSMHKSYRTLWLSRTNEIEHPWLTSTV